MSNETPSEQGHWRDRLDRLDNLPDEPWTGKDAAWDTLYDRIRDRPRRGNASWYRVAAASVLLVAGIATGLIFYHGKRARPEAASSVNPATAAPALPVKTPAAPGHSHTAGPDRPGAPVGIAPAAGHLAGDAATNSAAGNTAANAAANPLAGDMVRDAARNHPAGGTAVNAATRSGQTMPATAGFSPSAPEPASTHKAPLDAPVIAVVSPPVQTRKLSVVSINELTAPSGADGGTRGGGSSGNHYGQFKFLGNPFYSETAIENTHPQSGMLQIKIHR